jgi:pimeloyl-ACP methyl ester carboxylesterase
MGTLARLGGLRLGAFLLAATAASGQGSFPEAVTSKDGTRIACARSGSGPCVILVSGALSDRSTVARLAELLSSSTARSCSVVQYDRRGRGASGDTLPYAVEREVEDLAALIDAAGGSAALFGTSSGAVLALEAATRLAGKVPRLVLFEPPFVVDDSRPPVPADFVARVRTLVADGRRGEAVELFLRDAVGLPGEYLPGMKGAPMWKGLEALAHTLAYDGEVMGGTQAGKPLPLERWAGLRAPTLVVVGGASDPWIASSAAALADGLAHAELRTLEGLDHSAASSAPDKLAPVLSGFLVP